MIKIKNIYYMLAYSYSVLHSGSYERIEFEKFEYALDLLSHIFFIGVSNQLKRGVYRTYQQKEEELSSPKGKFLLSLTIAKQSLRRKKIYCAFDDFNENNYFNQIIKATVLELIKQTQVSTFNKKELKRVLPYFSEVSNISLKEVQWNHLEYNKNNSTYELLMNISYLVYLEFLPTETLGNKKMKKHIDDLRMCEIYEKFVLAYYKKHFPDLRPSSPHIKWDLMELKEGSLFEMPTMRTDIVLNNGTKKLIIDTKYYTNSMQNDPRFRKNSYHSQNLYQIFTYVKSEDKNHSGLISGVLLYAKTDNVANPDGKMLIGKNEFWITTLDLNVDFSEIKNQLNGIAEHFFDVSPR